MDWARPGCYGQKFCWARPDSPAKSGTARRFLTLLLTTRFALDNRFTRILQPLALLEQVDSSRPLDLSLRSNRSVHQNPLISRFARDVRFTKVPQPLASLEPVGSPRPLDLSLPSRWKVNQDLSTSRFARSGKWTKIPELLALLEELSLTRSLSLSLYSSK